MDKKEKLMCIMIKYREGVLRILRRKIIFCLGGWWGGGEEVEGEILW